MPARMLERFPHVPMELVTELERHFPDRCPDGRQSDLEIRERIGEVRVVRFLRALAERQARLNRRLADDGPTPPASDAP